MNAVDIVVPVYRGEAETRACLESVLAARNATASRVVAIDDASPEPAISAYLRGLAAGGRIELLAHAANRGFVASVNEGMALHPGRDVVLLNSDTEVADGWLDRLQGHVLRDPGIGTVTPFSTNATILSYPRAHGGNALPEGETTASLDRAFAAANAQRAVEIPTAVGFCMLITRACLARIGAFDAERYGAGYGEEVDFCMRAARAGLRHVAAGDAFVRHVGEVSFGGAGAERRRRAQALVDTLYPEFQPRLAEFLAADPLRMLRRRADLERLKRSPRPRAVVAQMPAGPPDSGREVLLLAPAAPAHVELRWLRPGEEFALWLHAGDDWDALLRLLRYLGAAPGDAPDDLPPLEPRWLAAPAAAAPAATPTELEAALDRIRALESSTSWRVTAPLRAAAAGLRRLLPRR